jgi:hypothetical protein
MRKFILILAALSFLFSPVSAQEKEPRDTSDKKEQKQEKPETKLGKIKGELAKEVDEDDDSEDDGSDNSLFADITFNIWHNLNKDYVYEPYPYYGRGLFDRDSTLSSPLHFETAASAFRSRSNINGLNFFGKAKFYTLYGLEFKYDGLAENDLFTHDDLKMYRLAGVVNLLTTGFGYLEFKLGAWNLADIDTGPLIGLQTEIAPVHPLLFNLQASFSEINGHNIADYALTIGYAYKYLEICGGYRVFDLAGENIDGPIGGVAFRF